jgi:hypothetical protein
VPAENQNGLLILIHKKWIHISLNRKTEDDLNMTVRSVIFSVDHSKAPDSLPVGFIFWGLA